MEHDSYTKHIVCFLVFQYENVIKLCTLELEIINKYFRLYKSL